jgi:hypothetical protein
LLKTVTNKTKAVVSTNLLQRILLPFRSAVRINGIVVIKKKWRRVVCIFIIQLSSLFKNAMEKNRKRTMDEDLLLRERLMCGMRILA